MSDAIRYGIDLGTTHSAIAVSTGAGDEVRIIKNRDQMEVTASAVRIEKSGSIQVGRRAYETLSADRTMWLLNLNAGWAGKKKNCLKHPVARWTLRNFLQKFSNLF